MLNTDPSVVVPARQMSIDYLATLVLDIGELRKGKIALFRQEIGEKNSSEGIRSQDNKNIRGEPKGDDVTAETASSSRHIPVARSAC